MKYFFAAFILTIVIFSSCSDVSKETEKNNRINMLLPSSVPVNHIFMLDNPAIPNWVKEIKATNLLDKVLKKALHGEITVYNTISDDNTICTKEEILNNLGTDGETNMNQIKAMYFEEDWFLDTTEPFLFEKKVNCWYPVRYFQRDSMELKKLLFKLKGGNPTELLAKNIISEFNLEDTVNESFLKNLDKEKLIRLLIDYALSGKVKLWNAMDSEIELSKEEVNTNLGKASDTIMVENAESGEMAQKIISKEIELSEIQSIVFVEDWYYDPTTFAIKKVITGIGPVRYFMKYDGEMTKQISFMMYLGNEKTKLF